ncbi:MAG TPA: M20/M25/M40 family metallo-hydrolase [Pyrinomonadaceae bacterium]|jgi:hypothetical protein
MADTATQRIERSSPSASLKSISRFAGLAALLIVALCAALAVYRQSPPPASPASAPAAEFASGRAMKHVETVARRPHPIGSAEHAAVRAYILGELTAQGLAPETQRTTIVGAAEGVPRVAGSVENIVGRLKGTGNTKALMLAAHYDSVPAGPGASDDGSGVATLLETLRALKSAAPLRNDVIFLFTDGEEMGLLGAQAFVAEHPSARDVGLVLNFEARGSSGPAYMYETSTGNRRLIQEFAEAAPRPVTNSLLYEVYKLLPNDTDLSVFKRAGLKGLNFAYIDQSTNYHTRLDDARTIDQRSLQHQGSYALALARHFGNLDLAAVSGSGDDAVYFDLFGAFVVRYPASWALVLTVLTLLFFVAVIVLGFRRRRLTVGGMAAGLVALLVVLLGAYLLTMLVWRLFGSLYPEYIGMSFGDTYNSKLYLAAFIALTLSFTSALYLLFGKRVSALSLLAGASVWWALALLLTTLFVPGASYLFTWTLLAALVALLVVILSGGTQASTGRRIAALFIGAIPAVVLFSPLIETLFVGLTVGSSALVMLVVALVLALVIPQLKLVGGANGWLLPLASLVVCVAFLVAAALTSRFDASRPRRDNLFYALEADAGRAFWASTSLRADDWTSQFFSAKTEPALMPAFFPHRQWRFLTSEAPMTALAAPQVELLSDERNETGRTLRLRAGSPRRAQVLSLYVEGDAEARGTTVNGKALGDEGAAARREAGGVWALRFYAPPPEGIELTLTTKSQQPVRIKAVDQSYELPTLPGSPIRPRPDSAMASPHPLSDSTLVSKSFTF